MGQRAFNGHEGGEACQDARRLEFLDELLGEA